MWGEGQVLLEYSCCNKQYVDKFRYYANENKNVFCTQCDAIRNLLQRSKHIIPKSMLEMSMSRRI